jgi:hypothetical protein
LIRTIAPSYRFRWNQHPRNQHRNLNPNHCLILILILIPNRYRSCPQKVCCLSLIRWDRCRLDLNHYHLVPMIQIRNLKACCHFVNRIESPTENQSLNPIDCLIHFAIRFHSVHCSPKVSIPKSRWIRFGHWSPKDLMIRNYPMSHYPTNR